VDDKQPTPAEWAMIGGGALTLVASFIDGVNDTSAWSSGAFPIVTLIPLYVTIVAILVAATRFGNVRLPASVLGFTWTQIYLALTIFAALMALFWIGGGAQDTGAGLVLMLVGSVAAAVGAFLEAKEAGPRTIG
jgi:hypothetical protein